jgi:hypothetical protein
MLRVMVAVVFDSMATSHAEPVPPPIELIVKTEVAARFL